MGNVSSKLPLTVIAVTLLLAASANAGTQVVLQDLGITAPTPGPNDIAQLGTAGNTTFPDGLNYYTDNQAQYGAGEPGQTFTTGSNPSGYAMTRLAISTGTNSGNTGDSEHYYLHIDQLNGDGTITPLVTNLSQAFTYTAGDWLEWDGLAVNLAPNTTYAWSFGKQETGSLWDDLTVSSGNPYAGGQIALVPVAAGIGITYGSSHGFDAVFDLGLSLPAGPSTNPPLITIDISPAGQRQVIDGFGTCLAGSEAVQTWWQNLYYGDLRASMLRMALTPVFKSPYSDNEYNSPSYGQPGPNGNYARTYTNATTYTNVFSGSQAKIAVMGPNIDSNIVYFDFTAIGSNPQVAGQAAQAGKSLINSLGDFKLFGSLWSPAPWLKLADGHTYSGGDSNYPAVNTPFPFIWLGNFSGGVLDTSGTARPEFDDSSLGGTGPTSALTQFARCTAAYLRGFQNAYGVPFYALSLQNELDFDEFYDSCFYPLGNGYTAAIKAVRAELDKYPDLAGIKIMGPEDVLGGDYAMWQYGNGSISSPFITKNLQFLQAVGADPVAAAAEDFFCIHDYDTDSVQAGDPPPIAHWNWWVNGWGTSPDAGLPANVRGFTYYAKKSWQTENSGEDPAWLNPSTGFPGGGAWSLALRIQQALTLGQESAWAYWQMTDGTPVRGETLTDSTTLQNSPKFIAAKHFFRYIRPNSLCVNATVTGSAALTASAFWHNSNSTMTVVLINSSNSPIQAVINSPAQPAGIPSWQTFTSSSGSYWQISTTSITNGYANVSIPGYGVVTLYGVAPSGLRLTWNNPVAIMYGTALSSNQLNATANVPGTFAYTPAVGTVLNVGTNTLSAIFTPTDTVDYSSATNSVNLVVLPASPFASAVVAANPVGYWRLNETNNPSSGTVVAVDAMNHFNGTYGSASADGVAGPTPSFGFPGFESYNTAAQFSNGVANSFVTLPALNLNTNTVTISAWIYPIGTPAAYCGLVFCRPGGDASGFNFTTGGQLGYTWNQNNSDTWAWSSGLVPPLQRWSFVALVISPESAITYLCNTNGVHSATNAIAHTAEAFNTSTLLGGDTADGGNGGKNFNGIMDEVAIFNSALTPPQVLNLYFKAAGVSLLTWTNPAAITYGTALSSNQLNATASVPGSPAYSPALGIVLSSGTNTLSVIFTPTDTVDYSSATSSVSLVVLPAPLTVTAANANRAYGQTNPVFTGTIAGLQNGDNITATYSCSATTSNPVGTYAIVPILVDPNNRQTNYTVSRFNGTLTVTPAAPPTIVSVTPDVGPTNGGTTVTILGTGFESGATVNFGLFPTASVNVLNATNITALTPASSSGSVNVVVTNADGQSTTLSNAFTYAATTETLPVIQAVGQSGSSFTLTWSVQPAHSYQLQFKTDLNQANWNNLGSPVTATNTTATASDTIGLDPQRFYRVALLP
jgi:O-glycosyl hydrolase